MGWSAHALGGPVGHGGQPSLAESPIVRGALSAQTQAQLDSVINQTIEAGFQEQLTWLNVTVGF